MPTNPSVSSCFDYAPGQPGAVSRFIDRHFRHFNAVALKDAAEEYSRHLDEGGVMLLTLMATTWRVVPPCGTAFDPYRFDHLQ